MANRTHDVVCTLAGFAFLTGCTTIPTGRTAVEWTPTQGTLERPLGEGFHVVSPFAEFYQVDLREQEQDESLDVLANNGLDIKLTSSILYQPASSPTVAGCSSSWSVRASLRGMESRRRPRRRSACAPRTWWREGGPA